MIFFNYFVICSYSIFFIKNRYTQLFDAVVGDTLDINELIQKGTLDYNKNKNKEKEKLDVI